MKLDLCYAEKNASIYNSQFKNQVCSCHTLSSVDLLIAGEKTPDCLAAAASAASCWMCLSETHNRMFSGLMSVWMILHLVCR